MRQQNPVENCVIVGVQTGHCTRILRRVPHRNSPTELTSLVRLIPGHLEKEWAQAFDLNNGAARTEASNQEQSVLSGTPLQLDGLPRKRGFPCKRGAMLDSFPDRLVRMPWVLSRNAPEMSDPTAGDLKVPSPCLKLARGPAHNLAIPEATVHHCVYSGRASAVPQ